MRRSLYHRLIALLLSWAVPATNSWGMAPPIVQPGGGDFDATASAGLSEPSPSGGGDGPAVRPLLECVRKKASGSFTAFFGYKNEGSSPVSIPIGHYNGFFPGADNRGQPTTFQQGQSPHYPNPAFGVAFGGLLLVWTLRGPDGEVRTAAASPFSPRCSGPGPSPSPTPAPTPTPVATPPPAPNPACEIPLFGPKRFTRTRGSKTTYQESFVVPAWAVAPFTLSVENGEANGQKRALAWIRVNGQLVVRPRDLHRHRGRDRDDDEDDKEDHRGCGPPHASLERPITLTPGTTATLRVTVVGAPGTHVTVRICGRNGDVMPPSVTWSEPSADGFTSDTTPRLVVRYQDAMSGVDTSSLRALLDDVDVSSLFTLGSDEANSELPDAMALQEGAHTLRAEVRDRAGNLGAAASSFRVDLTPPVLALQLSDGAYVGQLDPSGNFTIKGSVSDVDPSVSIVCGVSGQSYTGTIQNGQLTCSVPLTEGKNSVSVRATDSTGHVAEETRTVNYDRTDPVAQFVEPVSGTFTAAMSIEVTAQALDASPVTGTVNGAPAACVETAPAGPDGQALHTCTGTAPLIDGTNAIVFVATDAAGNSSEAQALVVVDRVAPLVAIGNPAAGSYHRGGMLTVSGTVTDTAPVVVEVNGIQASCGGLPTCAAGGASFTVTLPATDGPFAVRADARDAAGNLGSAEVGVNVDSAPPLITITTPADGFVTNATALTIAGTLTDGSPSNVFIEGQPVPCSGSAGPPFTCTFAGPVALSAEGTASFEVRARDAAGNESVSGVAVTVDRTAPMLEIASPSPGAAVGSLPVLVQGTVTDMTEVTVTVDGQQATRTGQAWLASFGVLPEGPRTFTVVATDAAGNQMTRTVDAIVDLGPPAVSIDAPAPGFLTRESSVPVTATVSDRSAVTATLGGVPMTCTPLGSGSNSCTGTAALDENDNTLLVSATDATGRTTEQSVTVTRDSIAPTLELLTPATISRGRPGAAGATVSDALGVERVVLSVACVAPASCAPQLQTFTAPPYSLALTVPKGVDPGDTLAVTAEAFDRAGNAAQATRNVRVIGDGAVVGQALNDATGLPLPGATARLLGPGQAVTRETTTDERGRYSLPTTDLAAVVRIERDGFTSVERQVNVASGAGTVPVDARLTMLADEKVSDGTAPLVAGAFSLSLAAGSDRLTPLSPQGLPGLLPLGFSPLAALDLRVSGEDVNVPHPATLTGLPNVTLHLVRYDFATHAWRMVGPSLQATDGALTISLPEQGAYAVVAADPGDPPIAIPAVDEPLAGIAMVAVPVTAVSTGQVEPSVISPTGGTAVGRIAVTSPVALPSGTVVQADITETYSLASGDVASEERRVVDIILYSLSPVGERDGVRGCDPGALCASFPIRPSRTYSTGELLSGKVHLDILAGREGVRGSVGGSESVMLEAGAARLFVAQGALFEDTAFVLEEHALSAFLPSTTALVPLAEVVADFSGQTLNVPAELSISSPGVGASDTLVFAKVERVDGIPRYAVVALGQLVGDRIVSRPYPGLAGVVKGGRYVLYRLGAPIGFVAGIVSSSVGPVKALVEPAPGDPGSLPFIASSGTDGTYILASATGPRNLQARVVGVALVGGGSAVVPAPDASNAPQTASLNFTLAGAVTTASVNPPDGTLGVNTTTAIEISSSSALNPGTVVPANFALTKLGATPAENAAVAFRLVLASSGKLVSVIPQPALEYSKMYQLEASGLVDQVGGAVVVPTTTFRTKDFVAPFYDPKKLVFSMPNQDGIVTVTAPGCHPEPGCFYPGTTVLIINSGNGVVLSLVAGNDGEINSELPGSINDTLFVTINDPLGNSTSFTKSQYFDPLTKQTAVGPGGGVVEASDESGVELRIPEGALEKGATFKISLLPESAYADTFPNQVLDKLMPGTHVGGVLKIEASPDTVLKKYAKLAFPMPDFTKAPEGERPTDPKQAFYYVSRAHRVCPGGGEECADEQKITLFETIDEAQVEGEGANAKIATASPPFPGLVGPIAGSVALMIVSWEIGQLLNGLPVRRPGMIAGTVQRQRWSPGAATPVYDPVSGAEVSGRDLTGEELTSKDGGSFATTQSDGKFVLWDMTYSGGLLNMTAKSGIQQVDATAYEATDTFLQRYQKRATVNLTFPAVTPPPLPPGLEIRFLDAATNAELNGMAVMGNEIKVSLRLANDEATLQSGAINGEARGVSLDPLGGGDPRLWILGGGEFRPDAVGVYTVQATALPRVGPPFTVTKSIRVIAAGGSIDNLPNDAPRVTFVSPTPESGGVNVDVLPEVLFSEPVKRLRNPATGEVNVQLYEVNGASLGARVPLLLSGISPTGGVLTDQDLQSSSAAVTSLTLQPAFGLKYGQIYRLVLTDGIEDLDRNAQEIPAPKKLVPFESEFLTFGPVSVGMAMGGLNGRQPLLTGSPGIVVAGDNTRERAYITSTYNFVSGSLLAIDLRDPVQPTVVGQSATFAPRPYDLATESGTNLVAVAVGPTTLDKPSSVLLFDVTEDKPVMVGAASVVTSAFEGFISRIAMKGNYVYSATSKKGIQAVNTVVAKELWAQEGSGPTGVLNLQKARTRLNTAGEGFGQEAVELTVSIPKKANRTGYQLTDIRVLEQGGLPIAVVTGEPGLIVASPQIGALLYPLEGANPFEGHVEYAVMVPGSQGQPPQRVVKATLTWGTTLAVGRLQDKDVAIVVGNGMLEGGSQKRILMTVDLSSPESPQGLGFVDLSPEIPEPFLPVDVQLREQTALIGVQTPLGEQGYVVLINVATPADPQLAGRIQDPQLPIGGKLAFDKAGLLYSSARMTMGGESALGGVKTATFKVMAAVMPVRPTISKLLTVAQGQPQQEQTVQEAEVNFGVFPRNYKTTNHRLEFRTTSGQTLLGPFPVALQNGAGRFLLPKGFTKDVSSQVVAVFSFDTMGKQIASIPRQIEIGTILLRVDSNNDTIVAAEGSPEDNLDETAAREGKAFSFWTSKVLPLGVSQDLEKWKAALTDFASLSVRPRVPIAEGIKIGIRMPNSAWRLSRKVTPADMGRTFTAPGALPPPGEPNFDWTCVDERKLHLCHAPAATYQARIVLNVAGATDTTTPQVEVERAPSSSGGDLKVMDKAALPLRDNEFLFACDLNCADRIEVGIIHPDRSFEPVSEAKVQIKPFNELASLVTLRRSSTPSEELGDDHFKVASEAREEIDWAPLPDTAKQVTLIVHGYLVGHEEFKESHFAEWAKRLYWAGQPILDARDQAHAVGVTWPGNVPGRNLFWREGGEPYFPEDEFNALQAGVPLGKYLAGLRQGPEGRKISILAHSLGNMVVNSALREIPSSGASVNYVMNQAAIASDAFLQNYNPADLNAPPGVRDLLLVHAQNLGYPKPDPNPDRNLLVDQVWENVEAEIFQERDRVGCSQTDFDTLPPLPSYCSDPQLMGLPDCLPTRCDRVRKYYEPRASNDDAVRLNPALASLAFTSRWRQFIQDDFIQSAWTNFFNANLRKPGIKLFNTFNRTDWVLRIDRGLNEGGSCPSCYHSWMAAQILAKPWGTTTDNVENALARLLSEGRGATDTVNQQKWMTLRVQGRTSPWRSTADAAAEQAALWDGAVPTDAASVHQRTRQWAELALWFPALAPAAGSVPIADMVSEDFTSIGGAEGEPLLPLRVPVPSHSYLRDRPLDHVWTAFRKLRHLFEQ